ncbi:MAG: metallophosphoesterase [Bacteroidales bacterium]|nr:metallophosphoesterase [Bacteroidales bacterium]
MKLTRVHFKLISLSIISLLLFITSCHEVSKDLASSDKYRLVWNDDPSSTMTIAWDQFEGETPVVLYGEKDFGRRDWRYKNKQVPSIIQNKYGMSTHFAKLSNLDADENYYFVIKDSKGVSERYWFKTAPDKPEQFTFIAGGDTKSVGPSLEAGKASNRLVAKLRPLFVLFSGDFTSGNGTNPEYWQQWLNDWHELTTTSDGRMIPIIPVHGNHENGNMANLSYIFNAPFQSNDSANIYNSLSLGGDLMHIIALNSEIEEGGLQREWLENDLKNHKDFTFKIAAYHKPFWPHTSSKREQEYQYNQWAGLFYEYGLSLSFDADSHMSKITFPIRPDSTENSCMGFIRDDENGTMFLGEGSWGAHPRKNDDDKPWTFTSGSFNGFKWGHVFPGHDNEPAHVKIYTVISADYYEGDEIILYDSIVEMLTDNNCFDIPENLKIHKLPDGKDYVIFPFK